MRSRSVGLLLGFVADRLLGDPQRFHPVAGFGRAAGALESRMYGDSRARGAWFTATLVAVPSLAGARVERRLHDRPVLHTFATAITTWAVLGGASLAREASAVDARMGDLSAARQRLTHLVGRDTTRLDSSGIARACVESVAENTSDAVVAPLVLGGIGGIGGLLGYRAANTLDAMVGHHDARYERFGWASARLDDVLNLPGSRLTAFLAAALAPTIGGSPAEAVHTWWRSAGGHPSPNAGPVEAAFAGALGIRLGGTNIYGDRVEHRPGMGVGRSAGRSDISRSVRLADRVGWAAVLIIGLAARRLHRRGPQPGQ